jgi:chloramphenicol-sensitive protein RarD
LSGGSTITLPAARRTGCSRCTPAHPAAVATTNVKQAARTEREEWIRVAGLSCVTSQGGRTDALFQPTRRSPRAFTSRSARLGAPAMNAAAARATGHAAHDREIRRGFALGVAAYGLWGVLPIYFKAIAAVAAIDIVAHRVLWSLPFLALLLFVTRGWGEVAQAIRRRRTLLLLLCTAVLIGINWLLYVYAVTSGQILAGSLGYYLNPLVNVLLGRFVLKERLSWLQWAAIAIAAAGILALIGGALDQLWISLTLAITFATYGLLRKIALVDAVAGLTIETAMLVPLAIGWLAWGLAAGQPSLGSNGTETGLLLLAGVVSTIPLLLFTAAARRLPYSTLGMLQFLAPTLQFLLAVWLYGEPFGTAHAIAFGAIWTALALYTLALIRAPRAQQAPPPPE